MNFNSNLRNSPQEFFIKFAVKSFFLVAFGLTLVVGYVMNIINLISYKGEATTGFYVAVVGVILQPLGSIMGYVGI